MNKVSFAFSFCWREHGPRKMYTPQVSAEWVLPNRMSLLSRASPLPDWPLIPAHSLLMSSHHYPDSYITDSRCLLSVSTEQKRTVRRFRASGSIMSVRASILWRVVIDRPLSVWAGVPFCKYSAVDLAIVRLIDIWAASSMDCYKEPAACVFLFFCFFFIGYSVLGPGFRICVNTS